jgi:hypothetical protein
MRQLFIGNIMRIRNDWLKYRSETLKYDPLIQAAENRKNEFMITSQWSFNVLGPGPQVIAKVRFGWIGIEPGKSCPTIHEFLVLVESEELEEIVRTRIVSLYLDLPWVQTLSIRFLTFNEFYDHHRLPHLDGWYESDSGKVHFCLAYQDATSMPFMKSKCGNWRGLYYSFRDPIPFIEPEYATDVCKSCLRTGAKIDIKGTDTKSGSIEVRIYLSIGETYADFIDRIEAKTQLLREDLASIDYIHIEVIGASWSLLLANECAQQIRHYCQEHFSQVETYVTYW